jgi:hypothetical protein
LDARDAVVGDLPGIRLEVLDGQSSPRPTRRPPFQVAIVAT